MDIEQLESKKESCRWLIKHYKTLAENCFDIYPDLCDAYLVWDHYMTYVEKFEDLYDRLCQIRFI